MSSAYNLLTHKSFWSVKAWVCFEGIVVHHRNCHWKPHQSVSSTAPVHHNTSTVTKSSLSFVPTQITFRWLKLIPLALRMSPHIPAMRYKSFKIMRAHTLSPLMEDNKNIILSPTPGESAAIARSPSHKHFTVVALAIQNMWFHTHHTLNGKCLSIGSITRGLPLHKTHP